MKKILFFTALVIQALVIGCVKPDDRWDIPPEHDIFFKIKENDVFYTDADLRQLKVGYYNRSGEFIRNIGEDYYDTSFVYAAIDYLGDMGYPNVGFLRYLQSIYVNDNIETFYMIFPAGDTSVITVNAKTVSNKEGKNHYCYCTTPLTLLKFNGVEIQPDNDIKLNNGQPVFIFEK